MNNRLKDITNQRLWKMALCGILTLGSVVGYSNTVQAATVQQQFQDTRTSYAKDAITHLVDKGIAAGTSETTFEPKKAVTRAEFATFAVRLLGLKPVKNNINPYQDISMNAWYYGNVAAMTNLFILEGKGQGTFQPDASITREEAAALLVRMLKQQPVETSLLSSTYFDADDISDWARPYVQTVYQLGLMKGSGGVFRPHDQVTREEAAVMLDAILQKKTWSEQLQRGDELGVQLGWQYNSTTAEFKKQVEQSEVNTLVPRWFFLNSSMKVTDHADPALISWASATDRQLWPLLGNRSDPALTHQMLSSSVNRAAVISQVAAYVKTYKLDGINVDFENVDPADREGLTAFVTSLTATLHALGAVVSVDVSPDLGTDWTDAFDYAKLGAVSDYMVLMGYEEHWNGDPKAGSVASLPWVEKALDTMLSEVVHAKTILALPLYTRDWSSVNPAASSWDITLAEQGTRAHTSGSVRRWDAILVQYIIGYNSNGMPRYIWAEDSRSLSAKVLMSEQRQIAGLAYWYMGGETADVWNAISNASRFESYNF
ncbi:S-layer homology domain-containing protein [Paenibacillus sp. LS1]|uniref:S-layer homology domain-containing protein n=1 Tax=Paenibacillus sp. LS1 TaxID=2992120 RepID=UPI002232B3E9|nr:S-layer homology domain-containing protein [Paenibacillus sp. LS1]MCW3792000.1 S-layer homology domain-containing protein [Paenibacillus sp. LS1]